MGSPSQESAAHSSTTQAAAVPDTPAAPEDRANFVRVKLTRAEFIFVYIGLLFAILLASLDQTIVSTALKTIVEDFGEQELIPWIGSAYLLTAAPLGTLYGKFADIFGRKWVFVFAIVVFEFGSLICGVANSMVMLIVGRAIAGIGGGGIFSLVLIIVSDIVSMKDRGTYQGFIGAITGLSSVVAPLLGGAFSDNGLWRWCFLINLPLGAVTLLFVVVFLKFPREEQSFKEKVARIDFVGSVLLFGAILCLVTPLQLGGSLWAWNSAQVIVMFILAAVIFAAFVFVELKLAKEPIVPPSIFFSAEVPALLVIAFCFGAVFLSTSYYTSLFFQVVYGDTATQGGLALLPMVFGFVFMAIVSGILVSKFGRYVYFFYVGPVIISVGVALTSLLNGSSPLVMQIFYLLILGLGIGCVLQVRILAVQAAVPLEMIAVATGVLQTCNILGATVGIAISGTVINNVIAANTAGATDLQRFLADLAARGVAVAATDVTQVLALLNAAASTGGAAVASARGQLIDAFIGAFHLAYLCLLPYVAISFLLAIFVKQADIGKKKLAETAQVELEYLEAA